MLLALVCEEKLSSLALLSYFVQLWLFNADFHSYQPDSEFEVLAWRFLDLWKCHESLPPSFDNHTRNIKIGIYNVISLLITKSFQNTL